MIRQHLIYHGRVQGVGFRYTTNRIARRYEVKGYVKNLPSGTVELIVTGDETEVSSFLEELEAHFASHVTEKETSLDHSAEQFSQFSVRY